MAKKNAAPTKSEILATISKETELSKKQVGAVFDSLSASIKKSLRGHGLFTLPGLLKMKVVKKPATKQLVQIVGLEDRCGWHAVDLDQLRRWGPAPVTKSYRLATFIFITPGAMPSWPTSIG